MYVTWHPDITRTAAILFVFLFADNFVQILWKSVQYYTELELNKMITAFVIQNISFAWRCRTWELITSPFTSDSFWFYRHFELALFRNKQISYEVWKNVPFRQNIFLNHK